MSPPLRLAPAAAILALAGVARAEPRPIRVDYQAHAGCPDAAVLVEEITWRTPLARVAAAGEDALPVRARITRKGTLSRGRVTLGTGKDAITRDIEGPSCDEVVGALGLVTALALDPHASTARKPPPAPPAPPRPPPPPPPRLPAAPPLLPDALPPPALPEVLPPPLPAQPPPAAPEPLAWSVGVRALAAFAAAPGPLLGGALFVDRALSRRWGVSIRFTAEITATGAVAAGPGSASFLRAAGLVEGCAFAARPAAWLSLVPCVGAEVGVLRAEGLAGGAIVTTATAAVPWAALDLFPRLTADVGRGFVELWGGPAFPLVRRAFLFQKPESVAFALPPATVTVGLGGGLRFP